MQPQFFDDRRVKAMLKASNSLSVEILSFALCRAALFLSDPSLYTRRLVLRTTFPFHAVCILTSADILRFHCPGGIFSRLKQSKVKNTIATSNTALLAAGQQLDLSLIMASTSAEVFTLTYKRKAFWRTERLISMQAPNLTWPIHTLFSPAKFATITQSFAYPTLACQLSSLLLEKALPFCHSILVVGDSSPGGRSASKPCQTFPEPSASLTYAQKQNTHAMINEVATGISFTASQMEPEEHGTTTRDDNVRFANFSGRGSIIDINASTLRDIRKAERTQDTVAHLFLSLVLANTLVHEVLGHSLSFAVHSWCCGDGFVGQSQCSEIGYLLETFLFGGVILPGPPLSDNGIRAPCYYNSNGVASTLPNMICCQDYPNIDSITDYEACGQANPFRGPALPESYGYWNVPLSWVHDLFQQRFWDVALTQGNDALYPPKSTGWLAVLGNDAPTDAHIASYAREVTRFGDFQVEYDGSITATRAQLPVLAVVWEGTRKVVKGLIPRRIRQAPPRRRLNSSSGVGK